MTEKEKCEYLIKEISNLLDGESTEVGFHVLSWVMANVIICTAAKGRILPLTTIMCNELTRAVIFLSGEEEEEETMQ